MKEEVVFKETNLPPLEKEKKKRSRILNKIFNVLIVLLLSILSLAIGYVGQIIYNSTNYSSFFVNGMSMYPTINKNASIISDGKTILLDYSYGNFSDTSCVYRCETGLYDKSSSFLEKIERFSIVCTHYAKDYGPSGELKTNASAKIKRVVGLPGEWLYYENNVLNVSQDEGETWSIIDEAFLQPQSWWTEKEQQWRDDLDENPISSGSLSSPHKLGEDEYFVCGDNRRHSNDSRDNDNGPVKNYMIDGLVVLLNGETSYSFSGESWSTSNALFDYYLPWNYRYI